MSKSTQPIRFSKSASAGAASFSQTFKQAFVVKKNPFPWLKAFCAALSAALPVFIGLLLGSFEYGLTAGIGAFTFLYMFNQPFAQRAKKLFFVMIGLSLCMGLGTILAPYPTIAAIMMGIIGAIVIFIFGALNITGPSAVFFILCYAMATGMPVNPSLAPLRSGLVFLGGALSWVIAMLGWFVNPHRPERNAVHKVYVELAQLLDSIGTKNFNATRHQAVMTLKRADNTLMGGYTSWHVSDKFKRLYLLNEHANLLFLEILEISLNRKEKLPQELGDSVRALATSIKEKKQNITKILQPIQIDETAEQLFAKVYNADAIMNEPISKIHRDVHIVKPSLKTIFLGAFDKNSIVFLSSIKYGIVLIVAALLAHYLNFERSYWVPLSCAAVMSGSTIIATLHRAVQRTFGTMIGILVASLILITVHNGYIIALIILGLTFLTELFIVRNYGVAAMFFTPSALIMAEYATGVHDFSFYATVRLTDILVGSLIGLIGALIVGRRSASSLLPHFISKTIRSQGQFLLMLFSENNSSIRFEKSNERSKMQTNLINLTTVYNTALGELFSNKAKLESLWPLIFSIQQLGYLLNSSLKYYERPVLSDQSLAQLLYVFETMALSADQNQRHIEKVVPEIEGFAKIQKEILSLQDAMIVSQS